MRRKNVRGAMIAGILAIARITYLQAQTQDSARTYGVDPVVITASQTDALRSTIPTSISVVNRMEIEQSGETALLGLLNTRVPGLFVTERGVLGYGVANGAAGGISIHGMGESPTAGVLVMTDGRPQMMGLMGHPLPDTYVASGVDRVEIVRGPASLLYGSNAMGGVINIIPRDDYGIGFHGGVGLTGGSYGTSKVDLHTAYGLDPGVLDFSASRDATDGHRANSSFRVANGSLRSTYPLAGGYALSADLAITDFRTYDPGTVTGPLVNNWVDATRGSAGLTLKSAGASSTETIKLFTNWGRHDIFDGFHSTDQLLGIRAYGSVQVTSSASVTAGVDVARYGGEVRGMGNFHITEAAGYAVAKLDSIGPLSLLAGARLNHHSLYGNEFIPQAGVSARLSMTTILRASVSKGFRSPTIRELYLFPAPTPTLQPERMWNYEVGLEQHVNEFVSFELTGYVAKGSNLIEVGGAYPNLTLSNTGSFTHSGVDVSAHFSPFGNFDADLTYGYLDPEHQTNSSPRNKLSVHAGYTVSTVRINVGSQYVTGLYGADFSHAPLSDYALFNARVTWMVSSGLSLNVSAENLFERRYEMLTGYPMPRRTVFAGFRWDIR